jgi:hypothetical protein
MNVVDNLNFVQVINKPCMSSRNMCLLPRATLHSDSEQELHVAFLSKISYYSFADGADHPQISHYLRADDLHFRLPEGLYADYLRVCNYST